jgi:hypothetical protein
MFQGILISKDDAAYRATVQAIGEEYCRMVMSPSASDGQR